MSSLTCCGFSSLSQTFLEPVRELTREEGTSEIPFGEFSAEHLIWGNILLLFCSGWGIWTFFGERQNLLVNPGLLHALLFLLWHCCVVSIFPLLLQPQETNEKTFINVVRANGALQLSPCTGRKTFYLSECSWYLKLKQRMMRRVLCWQVFHRASSSLRPWLCWKSLLPFNIFILGFLQRQCTRIIPKWQCYKFLSY